MRSLSRWLTAGITSFKTVGRGRSGRYGSGHAVTG